MSTNWRVLPAADNAKSDDGFGTERTVEIVPSLEKMTAASAQVQMTYRAEPMMLRGGRLEHKRASREVHGISLGGDVEYGEYIDDNGNPHKVVTRMGGLHFSDGSQYERGYKLVMGKVVPAKIRMPIGAILHTREKSARDKGAAPDPAEISASNAYFSAEKTDERPAGLFQAKLSGPVTKKPRKERTGPRTKTEARQWLADAIANTAVLPPVKKYPDGFPSGPKSLAQLFPGLVKIATGDTGSQGWEETASKVTERLIWHQTLAKMQGDHVEILTRAVSAKNLAELGIARGYHGKYAIEAGRRLLIAANDNFLQARELAKSAKK
ncbi:hypothetical protein [Rhizobium sp. A37_96]